MEYQRKISGIMQRVALPVYSRAATLEDKRAVRARIVRAQSVLIFPLLAFFAATADTSVPWVFGEAWEPAVLPAQILAGAGMLAAVMTGMGPLVLAVGHPRALLAWDLASFAGFAVAVAVAAPGGVTAVCVAVVAVYAVQLLAAHWYLLRGLVGIPMRSVVSDVAPAAASSIALVAVVLPLDALLEDVAAHPAIVLGALGAAAAPAYLLALRQWFPAAWRDLLIIARYMVPARRQHKIRRARPVVVSE